VKTKRPQPCKVSQLDSEAHRQQERRSFYLRKMKGLCFKCLGRDHKVASCHDPTRYWRCRQFGHTSAECHPSSSLRHSISHPFLNLRDVSAPSQIIEDVGDVVDDNLLFRYSTSSTSYERRLDLMLLEALLMNQRYDIEGGSSTPPSTDSTPQVIRHHASTEDILTPVVLRSKAEQLIGQELIKVLSGNKQLTVAPVSSHSQQFTSSVKKSIVVRSVDARTFYHHHRVKIKSRKPVVKMVCDILIKK
jgi:hypothetical protein